VNRQAEPTSGRKSTTPARAVAGRVRAAAFGVLIGACCGACSGGGANVVPAGELQAPLRSLAILAWPTLELRPDVLDDMLLGLGEAFRQRHKFYPLTGLSLSRAVWRDLDNGADECRKRFDLALSEGRSALQALQLSRAQQSLDRAESHIVWCADALAAGAASELWIRRGALALLQARVEAAEADFRHAVALEPELTPQRFGLNPDALAVFERARRQLLSGKPSATVVFSWPEGAEVAIDGRPAGPTPCSLALFPGTHAVRVSLPGHAVWTRILTDGIPPAELRAWLFPLPAFGPPRALLEYSLADEAIPAPAMQQLGALARELKVEGLLLLRLARGERGLELLVRVAAPAQNYLGEPRIFRLKDPPVRRDLETVVKALGEFHPQRPRHGS